VGALQAGRRGAGLARSSCQPSNRRAHRQVDTPECR